MPTFYISSINPGSTELDTLGAFGGAVSDQPVTNSTTRNLTINTATAQAFFKFYMSDGRFGVGGVPGTFAYGVSDTTRSNEFVSLLATEVFGSGEANDFFSNLAAIHTSWDTAATTALGALNSLVNSNGAAASLELVNAMFAGSTISRFTLAHNATNTDNSNPIVTGTGYTVSGGSGSGAVVSVTATGATINSIAVTTNPTSGAYVKGETITITDGTNTATVVLSAYQAGSFNGTLANASGTEVPLEADDIIRILYTIASKDTQIDTSSDRVTATQTFFVDYTLTN